MNGPAADLSIYGYALCALVHVAFAGHLAEYKSETVQTVRGY